MLRRGHLGRFSKVVLISTFLVLLNLLVGVNLAEAATTWTIVPGAAVPANTFQRSLNAVAAVSANDVWAVGTVVPNTTLTNQPLAEHWNGSAWTIVKTPGSGSFAAVSADATNDVWAVGSNSDLNTDNSTPIVERWNGTSWSTVAGFVDPIPASADIHTLELTGVAALAPNNVWVSGWWFDNVDDSALIEHWNGRNWTVTPEPSSIRESGLSVLNAITAISPTDIWAVGDFEAFVGTGGEVAQAWHFDGTQWSLVLPTDPVTGGANGLSLDAVTAVSSNDVWAVGFAPDPQGNGDQVGLSMHWNGSTWTRVPVPSAAPNTEVDLAGVAAMASNDVWAVGSPGDANGNTALMEHWNGSQWSVVPVPESGLGNNSLAGIVKTGPQSFWAVGAQFSASTGSSSLFLDTLFMHTTNG